jgi:hypothetical protein
MHISVSHSLLFGTRKNRTKRPLAVGHADPMAEESVRQELARKEAEELERQMLRNSDSWHRSQSVVTTRTSHNFTHSTPPGRTRREHSTNTLENRPQEIQTPPTEAPQTPDPVDPHASTASVLAMPSVGTLSAPLELHASTASQAEEASQQTIRTSIERKFLKLDSLTNIIEQTFKLERELEQIKTEVDAGKRDPKKAMKAAEKIKRKLIALQNQGPQNHSGPQYPNSLDEVD